VNSVYAFATAGDPLPEETMPFQNDDKAMLVPVRTVAGDKALKDSEANMPRKLRALLSAIDNRAKTNIYCETLTAFGDVSAMFDSLEEIGMIRFVGQRLTVQASPQETVNSQEPSRVQPHPVPDNSLEDLLRQDQHVARVTQPQFTPQLTPQFKPQSQQSSRSAANVFKRFNNQSANPTHAGAAAKVEKVKALMTDFVLTHFPVDAMELTLAIDQIRTLDDLKESLSDYEKIAVKAPKAAPTHLTAIQSLLSH
jgi:hypothetical protein